MAGLRANILYRNNGDGTFTDVTGRPGSPRAIPSTARCGPWRAAFFDYDKRRLARPLRLELLRLGPRRPSPSATGPRRPTTATPTATRACPTPSTATTATAPSRTCRSATGIRAHVGKGMGIGLADFDDDGWPDLFVSNDNEPAFLFHNQEGQRFEEVALAAGVAYTEIGKEISGMGADARDFDNDGRPDIFQTALDGETMPLFRNRGGMTFEDWTGPAGLVRPDPRQHRLEQRHRRLQQRRLEGPLRGRRGRRGPEGRLRRARPARQHRLREPEERPLRGRLGRGGRGVREPEGRPPRRRLRRPRRRRPHRRGGERPRGAARDLAQRQPGAEPLAARQDRRARGATATASAPGSA